MTTICLYTSGFDRNTVCKLLSSSVKLNTYDVWKKFCEYLDSEDFQPSTSQPTENCAFYWDIYELLTGWCTLKQTESTLDSLLEILDCCELWHESDMVRETFSLAPKYGKLPEISVSNTEVIKEFGKHVAKNCSALSTSTKINKNLIKYLQESTSSEILMRSLETINTASLDAPAQAHAFYSALRNNAKYLENVIISLEMDAQYKPAWILRRAFSKFDIMETVFKPIACNPYDVDRIISSAFLPKRNKGFKFTQIFYMLFPEFGQFSPSLNSFLGILSTFTFTDGGTKEITLVEQMFKTLNISCSEVDGIFQFWVYLVKIYGILYNSHEDFPMIFHFMNVFPIQQTRVLILGQYPSPFCKPSGFAYHGCDSRSIRTILENLNFELKLIDNSLEIPIGILRKYETNCLLDGWIQQGVLMFNVLLTFNNIWSKFTDFLIKYLSENYSNIVFIITGKLAAKAVHLIDQNKHAVFKVYLPIPPKKFRWEDNLPLINANFYFYQVWGSVSSLIDWSKVSCLDEGHQHDRDQIQERISKYKVIFEELLKESNSDQVNEGKYFKCVVFPENSTGGTTRKLQIEPLSKITTSSYPISQVRSDRYLSKCRTASSRYLKTKFSQKK